MPPPEPTTSPSVDLEAIREKLRHVDVLIGLPGAAPQADLAATCEDLAFNYVADLLAEVTQLQAQVASMREVAEAARALLRSRTWANSSLVTSSAAPVRRLENAVLALRRLDATPQLQGDGQTRQEAGR